MSPIDPVCVCAEPGCGIQFAYLEGLTESRSCCYFCSQRKRLAADGDRARNEGEAALLETKRKEPSA